MNTNVPRTDQDITLPTLLKFLRADGSAPTGSGRYTRGRWRSVRGVLVPCENGLHAARADNLVPYINETLWRVEIDGEYVWHDDTSVGRKLVARRMRVVERIDAWNERTARPFAIKCAERVLPIYERKRPNDNRPREALAVARRFVDGLATRDELAAASAAASAAARGAASAAASAAARDAAWDAASAAARDAAWDAASAAAWDAARDAAWDAASAAARDAAWDAAWDAASAAASAAARDAASAAAWDAAWDAERQWQNRRLAEMLGLAVDS